VLAEALGEQEVADGGLPLRPSAPSGSIFERAIRRVGYDRDQFVIFNTIPTHPPKNWINPRWERSAIEWGRTYVDRVIRDYKPRCILALGNVALKALTGLSGEGRGVGHMRGWVLKGASSPPVIATYHPSFIRREAMPLFPVLMHDIKLAVAVANTRVGERVKFFSPVVWRDWEYEGFKPRGAEEPLVPDGYQTHPTVEDAERFLEEAQDAVLCAYDIETPRSGGEDDTDELGETKILSIQFSIKAGSGIYLPWHAPYDDIARRILALPNDKAGANVWRFDDPLLRKHGCELNGRIHDIRWAWHHLQPDLKAGLQFVASFYQEVGFRAPWKHLHISHPGFYGIADVDAVQRIMNGPDTGSS
jgi:uracil-DNA glycosylase family 4